MEGVTGSIPVAPTILLAEFFFHPPAGQWRIHEDGFLR
jgi:hypothetical protein